jgi:hypothetical protein
MSYAFTFFLFLIIYLLGVLMGKRIAYKHLLAILAKGEDETIRFVDALKKKYL